MTDDLELEDILEAIETYGIKKKSIVSLIFTSSMRAKTVCKLTIGDFIKATKLGSLEDALKSDYSSYIPCWVDKKGYQITFNTPTTTNYIIEYLKNESLEGFNENWPLFYSTRSETGFYTPKTIEQMMSSNKINQNFKQTKILDYFKHVCDYNLLVSETDKKYIIDLLMGDATSENPFIDKINELQKHYIYLLPYFGYNNWDANENQDKPNLNVRNIVNKYYNENVKDLQEDFDFEDHFELRHNAHLIAEKDAEEGRFKNNRKYLRRLFKKAKIEYIVYHSDYYSVSTYHPDRPIPGSPTNFDEKVYKIINDLGLKEELEISEELLKREIIAARIEKNISPYYSLTYNKLMIIFDCILLNIVDEIYLSDGI